jgi:putative endonuclease
MHYVYVIQSSRDKKFYVGSTNDLKRRVKQHNDGLVPATKRRRPLKLVYYEACISKNDAIRREKYLKTAWGKRYIKNRLEDYLTG